jgi:hypothetical protein
VDIQGRPGADVLAAAPGRVAVARDHGDLCGLISGATIARWARAARRRGSRSGVLSTGLGVLKLIEYRRDRPIIKVQLKRVHLRFSDDVGLGTPMLHANVINGGRRPARITSALVMLQRGRGFDPCISQRSTFPLELAEGHLHSFVWNEEKLTRH